MPKITQHSSFFSFLHPLSLSLSLCLFPSSSLSLSPLNPFLVSRRLLIPNINYSFSVSELKAISTLCLLFLSIFSLSFFRFFSLFLSFSFPAGTNRFRKWGKSRKDLFVANSSHSVRKDSEDSVRKSRDRREREREILKEREKKNEIERMDER